MQEPLSVILWNIGCRIEVQVNVFEVVDLRTCAIYEAVLVILPQDVLWHATVQAGDILQQGLEFRPHTRGDVQTREYGIYHGEV